MSVFLGPREQGTVDAKVRVGGWAQGSGSPGMRIGTKAEASNVVPGSLVVNSWTGSRGSHVVGIENSGDSRAPPHPHPAPCCLEPSLPFLW